MHFRRCLRSVLALVLFSVLTFSLRAQVIAGEVVAIADGDTLTVLDASRTQHKIRLAGIDAPERKQPFGQRARERLSDLVFRKHVEVLVQKRDRYGRLVGKVFYDGQDVNLTLVADGLAWHYKQYEAEQKEIDRALYAQAEMEARRRQLGLWSDPLPVPPWEWRAR